MPNLPPLAFALLTATLASAQNTPTPLALKFDFSAGAPKFGATHVSPTTLYSDTIGYGFEPSATLQSADRGEALTSDQPFFFSAKVPEGNYTVAVTFGDYTQPTTTSVKVESGRLMIERFKLPVERVDARIFTTNIRTAHLPKLPLNATGREEVTLDQFDRANARDWDDKLTVEIVGSHAALHSILITPAPSVPTLFLAGDSTVTDRDSGEDVSWGQLLPRFLKPGIAVANNAQSGETLKSFSSSLRFDKILSKMKKGDYLFLQFGHNDSKADWPQTYAEAETTYKAWLKVYIAEARRRGATPVLITPMDRADRTTGAPAHGHGLYPQALHEVAAEEHVPLIDLYNMSIAFYQAAGPDAPKILADGTHSTAYGGYEFAKCIVTGIEQTGLDLARFVVDDFRPFDPSHPDSFSALNLGPLFTK